MGIHAHEARTQEAFVITDGIDWRHHRIDVTMIGKHGHVDRRVESPMYLFLRGSCLFHRDIAGALRNGPFHDLVDLTLREIAAEGSIALASVLLVEGRLQKTGHVTIHRFLGIALHA